MNNKMKNHFLQILFACALFSQNIAFGLTRIEQPPAKTIVLKLPENESTHWKEISHYVTKKEGLVERIPTDQTTKKWSQLIGIQYFENSPSENNIPALNTILDGLREQVVGAYPGCKVTWNVIKKNSQDCLYEWILHQPYKDIPPQHEISRIFITADGLHRIGFTHQNSKMSADVRKKWIKRLEASVSLVSFEEAIATRDGLSMANTIKDSLDLGPLFENWEVVNVCSFANADTMVYRFPPANIGSNIVECLEVCMSPVITENSIDECFEKEKGAIRKKASQNVKFHLLKKDSDEIIYYYSYPNSKSHHTEVARILIGNQGSYSIHYQHESAENVEKKNVLHWAKHLQAIKIANRA